MVVEQEISSFFRWLIQGEGGYPGALVQFAATFVSLGVLALLVGIAVLLVRYGPTKAGEITYRTVTDGIRELFRISPRRIWALASLAVKESLRRRVLVGLGVFVLILLFASWFLKSNHQDPSKLYLSFVLTATTYLTLALGLLLSAFSLPNDFKTKTIFTIVTKPVRAGDIVLGRILGFTIIGTLMLVVMGVCSYVFVLRSLDHKHDVDLLSLQNISAGEGEEMGKRGRTSLSQYHRHEVQIDAEGSGLALSQHGHDHLVEPDETETSPPVNMLRARVPKRGDISFKGRDGSTQERGVSVGNEWTYRSFIEGGSAAAAIWTFEGIDESVLRTGEDGQQYLPVELIVRVFRTYTGDIERAIQGSIQLQNPETLVKSSIENFGAKDYTIDTFNFPREQFNTDLEQIDLIDDLVSSDGKIQVVVQSLERAQYYGFARADCYIRLPDGSPLLNFVKGYLSIWVQMVIVISIGVTASTFLNGPIAMMFTVAFILLGFFRDFLIGVATGIQPDGTKVFGGGPVESLVRLVTQKNLTAAFDEGPGISLMLAIDTVLQYGMRAIALILPDFRTLTSVNYVAEGFDIPSAVVGRELAVALAYIVGMSIAGYFFLRTREVAK